jgi:hypothetical protein
VPWRQCCAIDDRNVIIYTVDGLQFRNSDRWRQPNGYRRVTYAHAPTNEAKAYGRSTSGSYPILQSSIDRSILEHGGLASVSPPLKPHPSRHLKLSSRRARARTAAGDSDGGRPSARGSRRAVKHGHGDPHPHRPRAAGKPIHKPSPLACLYGQRAPGLARCGCGVESPAELDPAAGGGASLPN